MRLRVITVTRGESPYWAAAAASIATAAAGCDWIIVAPANRLERVLAEAPHARGLSELAPGLYPNLNHALAAPGDWDAFTWLNDDDILLPGFAAALRRFAEATDVDVLYGRVPLIDRSGQRVAAIPVAKRPADLAALWQARIVPLAQPGTLLRRTTIECLGGFDLSYRLAGDADLFIRALAAGARFEHLPKDVAAFRLVAGQLSKQAMAVEAETRRAVNALPVVRSTTAAVWRFKTTNLPAYLERVRRHGWKSMRQIYDATN